MALDRETLVRTALRLIDEGGLESLTLRKLAAELGVQAPALYWHFRNKRELLDAVATQLGEEQRTTVGTTPAAGQPWSEWLEERMLDARRGMLAHRDSALIMAGNRPTPDSLPGAEAQLSMLTGLGLSVGDALLFTLASGYFLIGGVLERQLSETREPTETEDEAFRLMQDADRYPTLAAAVAELIKDGSPVGGGAEADEARPGPVAADGPGALDDAVFRFGLGLMIDGLRARLANGGEEPVR
ncbi:TetR/AcrR family transcriptional regulator C-terminal domain-containing protein [Cryptosporangium minutisporangium]|uniref:Tetracycline resistance transcriptional repressor TetR(A) n=1 Tax=Cryptosporangium minutisporangium TaxID=113569 RepID=A0ABP6T7L9_9ACTN